MVLQEQSVGQVMDGKALAASVREELKEKVAKIVESGKRRPGLAVVLVGDDKASALYVKNKTSSCKKVGIESFMHTFPANTDMETLLACIRSLNQSDVVDGILVQLPLPKHLSADVVLEVLDPDKDVDGLTTESMGRLFAGKTGLRPCTPVGVMALLDRYKVEIEGKNAVVIGRSNLVGKPIAILLQQKNATVTMCHSRTKDLDKICQNADILVVAAGQREFVKGSWIKPGSTVIDVGIHHTQGPDGESIVSGDVQYADAAKLARFITPVPGGVGPMTVAMLLANTITAYERRTGGK
ncbi:MAG: bifunctional methylenetetrahydrofolate dehydrogenase/methenyltetrahydrofolate cyclohydrolase FolD [Candidatus Melainabacteria bacterium]|nr:MAG: bifunctional methylenetetrahydrofolate dehydrogenase/methenyltetrahydrofolate cyclohydrolase FolD [Candidatus Melainabacteria bacterium]